MPEGHTLHRLARDLNHDLAGQPLAVSSPQGRFPAAAALDGATLKRAFAIGKHLFLRLDDSLVHVHLGLFGKFRRSKPGLPPKASVRLRLEGAERTWDLVAPTCCECQSEEQFSTLQARLGDDPLGDGPRSRTVTARIRRSKRAIGALLLDQSLFSGIGNVYRAELLFLTKIHPETPGSSLSSADIGRLWRLAKTLLRRGSEQNRIVTVPGATRRTKRSEALYCYKRSDCRLCSAAIVRSVVGGRAMYHCPGCQPSPLLRAE